MILHVTTSTIVDVDHERLLRNPYKSKGAMFTPMLAFRYYITTTKPSLSKWQNRTDQKAEISCTFTKYDGR